MAVSYQVTVGPARVLLADQTTKPGGPSIVVKNVTGAVTGVYIAGDENASATAASSTTGFYLEAGTTSPVLTLAANEAVYAITNTNTVTVHVFRMGGIRAHGS